MNFLDVHRTRATLAKQHGMVLSEDAVARLSTALYHLAARLLDAVLVLTPSRTVRPEHMFNLSKVTAMMSSPIGSSGSGSGRGSGIRTRSRSSIIGGDPTLPMKYFGMEGGDPTLPMKYFGMEGGDPTLPMKYFGMEGGGGDPSIASPTVLTAILREYRARSGHAELRISEAARSLTCKVLDANAAAMLRAASSKRNGGSSVAASSLMRVAKGWKLVL